MSQQIIFSQTEQFPDVLICSVLCSAAGFLTRSSHISNSHTEQLTMIPKQRWGWRHKYAGNPIISSHLLNSLCSERTTLMLFKFHVSKPCIDHFNFKLWSFCCIKALWTIHTFSIHPSTLCKLRTLFTRIFLNHRKYYFKNISHKFLHFSITELVNFHLPPLHKIFLNSLTLPFPPKISFSTPFLTNLMNFHVSRRASSSNHISTLQIVCCWPTRHTLYWVTEK